MTLILAILALIGMFKAVETMSSNTALIGNQVYFSVTPRGFRGYYAGNYQLVVNSARWLKLNWGLILKIAAVLAAYHISSLEEIGGLAFMTMLNTEGPRKDPVKIWNLIVQSAHPTFFAKPTAIAAIKAIANRAMWLQQLLDIPPSEGNWNLIMIVKDADTDKVMKWHLKPADIGWKDTQSIQRDLNVNGHWTPLREFLCDIQKMGVGWTISGVTGLISHLNGQFKCTNGERTKINDKAGYRTLALTDQPNVRILWNSGKEDKLDIQESHLYAGRTHEKRDLHIGGNTSAIVRINSGIVKTSGRSTGETIDILPDLTDNLEI
jgi:hypothetical protein